MVVGLLGTPVVGCSRSGQTGSPRDDAPDYTSPERFGPDVPGGTTGEGNWGDGYYPLLNPEQPQLSTLDADTLFVWVPPEPYTGPQSHPRQRGLLTFDVSTGEPAALGALEVEGWPMSLSVHAGLATVVLDTHNEQRYDAVPEQPVYGGILRVLQIDVSDPSAPQLLDEALVEGRPARSFFFDDRLAVVTQHPLPGPCLPDGVVGTALIDLPSPPEYTVTLSLFEIAGNTLSLLDSLDLPAVYQFFDAQQGTLAAARYASPDGISSSVDVQLFDATGDSIVGGERVSLAGVPTAARLIPGALGVALELDDASFRYQGFSVGGSTLTAEGDFPLPTRVTNLAPVADMVLLSEPEVVDEFNSSLLIDAAGASSLATLPALRAVAVPGDSGQFLAMERAANGTVTLSLRDLAAPAAPIASVDTGWAHTGGGFDFDAVTGTVVYPYTYYDGNTGEGFSNLGVATLAADAIEAHPGVASVLSEAQPVLSTSAVYLTSNQGLGVVPLSGDAGSIVPLYPERTSVVLQEVQLAGTPVTLEQTEDGMNVVFHPEGDAISVALEHFAEELLVVGDDVLALGLRRPSDCDMLGEDPNFGEFADLIGLCPTPNVAGLSVIAGGAQPELVWSTLLPGNFDAPELPANATFSNQFEGYLQLPGDRVVLPASQFTRCENEAACDALGIEGEEGMASPGCNPQVQNCDELPSVITFFSGGRSAMALYLLDLSGSTPKFEHQVTVSERPNFYGEGPLSLESQILRSGEALGFPAYESIEGEEGLLRHFLTVVHLDAADDEQPVTVVTPGRALQLLDEGQALISVRPSADDAYHALVHYSRIEDGGVYIEDTLDLGPGFRDGTLVDDQLLLVFGPAMACEAAPVSRLLAVFSNDGELSASPALELPGDGWGIPWYARPYPEGHVLLSGGPGGGQGRALIQLGDANTAPAFVDYSLAH